jgi:fructokinase
MPADRPIVALGELLWDLLPSGPRAGGAPFNFAFHCHQLGHPAAIVSRVGDDDLGRRLRAEVRRLGLSDEYIQTDPMHPTGTVQVCVDAAGQPAYTITEDVAWDFIEWEPRLEALADSARAVCFGTLAQRRPASRLTIWHFLGVASLEIQTVCDVNLRPPFVDAETIKWSACLGADWIKLNEDEVVDVFQAAGIQWAGAADRDCAMRLRRRTGPSVVCITRGANGCVLSSPSDEIDLPGIPIRVADTIGAGDAFTAALLTQHLDGKPLRQAARFANAYAAVVASKVGGTPSVTRAEVERLL